MDVLRVKERLRKAAAYWRTVQAEGQGLVEYALILVFVGMAVILILALVGPAIGNIFSNLIPQL
jgi:pilus assembly protein Flp/PilA